MLTGLFWCSGHHHPKGTYHPPPRTLLCTHYGLYFFVFSLIHSMYSLMRVYTPG